MEKRVALLILDGWGMTTIVEQSAIAAAHTPYIDSLYSSAPHSVLEASEEAVWLPRGQVGNSEVGHSTLGTGRVNYQHLVRISRSISDRSFFEHKILIDACKYAKENKKQVHLMGLVSDGGVHSHLEHLFALIELLSSHQQTFFVHAITDGRDTDPQSWVGYIEQVQNKLLGTWWTLASIVGRYYAMDRDQRRERVKQAYDLYTAGVWAFVDNPLDALLYSYATGVTDEFIVPHRCLSSAAGVIQPWDVVICFNFRSDRARELTSCLTQCAYPDYAMYPIPDLHFISMTEYDATFQWVEVLFPSTSLEYALGEVLSTHGKTQLRIAETEKYPHVTFFFNGGREEPYPGEERIVIPSPTVATYDLQPAMSAREITKACSRYVTLHTPDFICLNYANPDMVGHTGVFDAVVEACETVDRCLEELVSVLVEHDYTVVVLADHGNADYMINDDGTPNTAHSLARVPCFLINWPRGVSLYDGWLADVAPTILELMGLQKPTLMTWTSLLLHK